MQLLCQEMLVVDYQCVAYLCNGCVIKLGKMITQFWVNSYTCNLKYRIFVENQISIVCSISFLPPIT